MCYEIKRIWVNGNNNPISRGSILSVPKHQNPLRMQIVKNQDSAFNPASCVPAFFNLKPKSAELDAMWVNPYMKMLFTT